MQIIKHFILFIILVIILIGIYLYKGMYNISATSPHNKIVEIAIHESMEKSVIRHAQGLSVPDLNEDELIKEGFVSYDSMCAMCHGAPGIPESVLYKGLYPKPPKLYEDQEEWTDEELFWIIKNGIKMTGMPAYGPTHSDEDVYAVVAFLKKLPGLSEREYEELMDENKDKEHSHSHEKVEKPVKENVHIHEDGSGHVH